MATEIDMVLSVTVGPELARFPLRELRAAVEAALRDLARNGPQGAKDKSWGSVAEEWLRRLPLQQQQVALAAARGGGTITRAEVLRISGRKGDELRGFTRPFGSVARKLQGEKLLERRIDPTEALKAVYPPQSGKADAFRLNRELVYVLQALPDPA